LSCSNLPLFTCVPIYSIHLFPQYIFIHLFYQCFFIHLFPQCIFINFELLMASISVLTCWIQELAAPRTLILAEYPAGIQSIPGTAPALESLSSILSSTPALSPSPLQIPSPMLQAESSSTTPSTPSRRSATNTTVWWSRLLSLASLSDLPKLDGYTLGMFSQSAWMNLTAHHPLTLETPVPERDRSTMPPTASGQDIDLANAAVYYTTMTYMLSLQRSAAESSVRLVTLYLFFYLTRNPDPSTWTVNMGTRMGVIRERDAERKYERYVALFAHCQREDIDAQQGEAAGEQRLLPRERFLKDLGRWILVGSYHTCTLYVGPSILVASYFVFAPHHVTRFSADMEHLIFILL
jgi:hypothetical protein